MAKTIHTHAFYDMIWNMCNGGEMGGNKLYWPMGGVKE